MLKFNEYGNNTPEQTALEKEYHGKLFSLAQEYLKRITPKNLKDGWKLRSGGMDEMPLHRKMVLEQQGMAKPLMQWDTVFEEGMQKLDTVTINIPSPDAFGIKQPNLSITLTREGQITTNNKNPGEMQRAMDILKAGLQDGGIINFDAIKDLTSNTDVTGRRQFIRKSITAVAGLATTKHLPTNTLVQLQQELGNPEFFLDQEIITRCHKETQRQIVEFLLLGAEFVGTFSDEERDIVILNLPSKDNQSYLMVLNSTKDNAGNVLLTHQYVLTQENFVFESIQQISTQPHVSLRSFIIDNQISSTVITFNEQNGTIPDGHLTHDNYRYKIINYSTRNPDEPTGDTRNINSFDFSGITPRVVIDTNGPYEIYWFSHDEHEESIVIYDDSLYIQNTAFTVTTLKGIIPEHIKTATGNLSTKVTVINGNTAANEQPNFLVSAPVFTSKTTNAYLKIIRDYNYIEGDHRSFELIFPLTLADIPINQNESSIAVPSEKVLVGLLLQDTILPQELKDDFMQNDNNSDNPYYGYTFEFKDMGKVVEITITAPTGTKYNFEVDKFNIKYTVYDNSSNNSIPTPNTVIM